DGNHDGVYAQRFDNQGNLVGDEFQVNTSTNGDQIQQVVTDLDDGNFLITWVSQGEGLYAQRFGLNPAPTIYTPDTPYQSETDSPFSTHPNLILEDFEDGLLNTPGVTASTGEISNTANTDSVDSLTGQSWRISENTLTLTFDETVLGTHPTDVGVAITDIETNNGTGTVRLQAWDAQGVFLGATQPQPFGDGLTNGSTAEDRFLGISHDNGISKVTLSTDSTNWELDHLQYVV
ncbi:MAG: hypothetical protein F6K03_18150, partial [Kamptonema sp. SIO4C4]|nr:hypothetical protein [Kamptonema sp. SIO4C4]